MDAELRTAIYSKFTTPASALYTAVAGRMSYGRGSQAWSDNYVVFFLLPSENVNTFDATIWDGSVQFSVFSSVATTCEANIERCRALYDGVQLTVSSHEKVKLIRGIQTPAFYVSDDDNSLWQAIIEFSFVIQKS